MTSSEPPDPNSSAAADRGAVDSSRGTGWIQADLGQGRGGGTLRFGLPGLPRRSVGLKFILVCFLALLMVIPIMFVQGVASERAVRAGDVARELGSQTGGQQRLGGPVLLVPYARNVEGTTETGAPRIEVQRGHWAIFPAQGEARTNLTVSTRARSIYKVPTYLADTRFTARFDVPDALRGLPAGVTLDWTQARLVVWAGDLRGVKDALVVRLADGSTRGFEPTSDPQLLGMAAAVPAEQAGSYGTHDGGATGVVSPVLADVSGVIGPDTRTEVSVDLKVTGAERISIAAFAQDTRATITGNWPSPKFEGAFLASDRRIGQTRLSEVAPPQTVEADAGTFEASWRAPFLARALPKAGPIGSDLSLGLVSSRDFAVTLVERSEVYAGVMRALRYALLFVGSVFLAFFLFEAMGGGRAHPAQYLLVGLAQCVFYLLLLAFAEQVGFDRAFLLAAVPTVVLAASYAGSVFSSRAKGLQALLAFSAVYALMYVLMTLEDQALLAGAVTAFAAISAVMWLTRKVNWYTDRTQPVQTEPS